MFKYILIALSIVIAGCHLVEVNMEQSAITDVGDGTADNFTSDDDKTNQDTLNVTVPVPIK